MAAFEATDITKVFAEPNGAGGAVLPVAETPSGGMATIHVGAGGGVAVEGVAGGTAVPVSGTVVMSEPSTHTALTANDDTDVAAFANVGLYIGGDGNLVYRTVGAPSVTITLPVVVGQFVWGQFTRVMAATTATPVIGVSR